MNTVTVTPGLPAKITVESAVVAVLENNIKVITLGVQGPPGATGPSGTTSAPINFSFGDASPAIISSSQPAQIILQIVVNIFTAFDGAGATLTIGTAAFPSLYVASSQIDASLAMEFEITVSKTIPANTAIIVTITPGAGATKGAGWILISRISV